MPQVVPTQPVANQTLNIQLSNQSVTLNIYSLATGLYMDVLVNNAQVIGGVICQNLNRIVRSLYLGFVGDFVWLDTQSTNQDPVYTGLGSQFQLIYLSPGDLPAGVG